MESPRALQPVPAIAAGELLAIVAPAGPVSTERLARGVAHMSAFRLQIRDDITRRHRYLAGTDEQRAEELNAALRNPDVRAILLARGGYGITRILPQLDTAAFLRDPKPIIGFSDGTALLAWVASLGYMSIHGPVTTQLGDMSDESAHRLLRLMSSRQAPSSVALKSGPEPLTSQPFSGPMIGGNLTLLAHLVGTPWHVDASGQILFIEDVGEAAYRIDRCLTQLVHAGTLDQVQGVIVGDFTRCGPPDAPDDPAEAKLAVRDILARGNVPTSWGYPGGHGTRNLAFPYGGRVTVSATEPLVEFHESAVR